jgi:uncharacterized protein (DUF362 family)
MKTQVSLTHGSERTSNLQSAIEQIATNIDFRQAHRILIKPNLVSPDRQLANTHPDSVRVLLDFIRCSYDGAIDIAEGTAVCDAMASFERFGYDQLANDFNARLVDLNSSEAVTVKGYNLFHRPINLRLARPVVESDFRISIGPPKTHNTVLVSLAIKNMVMGSLVNPAMAGAATRETSSNRLQSAQVSLQSAQVSQMLSMALPGPLRSDKLLMHQGWAWTNLNIAILAPHVLPHLAIIDGFEGMEGAGPTQGTPVDWRIALAGTDAVAVDWLTAHLMGFDPQQVGYLYYCRLLGLGVTDLAEIDVVGNTTPEAVSRSFQPSPSAGRQARWRLRGAEKLLEKQGLKGKGDLNGC